MARIPMLMLQGNWLNVRFGRTSASVDENAVPIHLECRSSWLFQFVITLGFRPAPTVVRQGPGI